MRPALTLTTVECFHIGRNASDRITELEAQQSDLRQLQTALATGQPVWPNNWSQPVAMVAYEFHLRQEQLAEAQRDASRYQWLRSRVPGGDFRVAGIVYSEGGEVVDAGIDAAMQNKEAT